MGKYMKKSKITGDIGVMEVSQSTTLGVRTRAAKALALQRLNSSSVPASASPTPDIDGSSCYLQLRSRRLEKPIVMSEPKKQPTQLRQQQRSESGGISVSVSRSLVGSVKSGTAGSGFVSAAQSYNGDEYFASHGYVADTEGNSLSKGLLDMERGNEAGADASFGENDLDFDIRDRSTRESTPCNFAGGLDCTATPPGSSTRTRSTATKNYEMGLDSAQRIVPTAWELDEFFAYAEQQEQRLFMEKYNFDVVNDMPLPGRYEWIQVNP